MSTDDSTDDSTVDNEEQTRAEANASPRVADDPDAKMTGKPEVTDEHREVAKEMREEYDKKYEQERPPTVMPGTGATVAGTAVNDWLDGNGEPQFGGEEHGGKDDEAAQAGSEPADMRPPM